MTIPLDLGLLAAILGMALVAGALWALARRRSARRWGSPVSFDDGRFPTPELRSEQYRLVGRPDEMWRRPDGRLVPVELKSRVAPRSGVFASHRIQVGAYCLLVEATTGRSPPYGVVQYAGREFRTVVWDRGSRAEVLAVLSSLREPYDGRASPSPRKCRGCRWRPGCDARAPG